MHYMTITETKARIRRARYLMRYWRDAMNTTSTCPVAIHLSEADFFVLEWGLGHLIKQWVPEYDEDWNPIPNTRHLVRRSVLHAKQDGTIHFMFRGIPVRPTQPLGLQW